MSHLNPSSRLAPLVYSLPVASPPPSKAPPFSQISFVPPTDELKFFPAAASTPRISTNSSPSLAPPNSIPASAPLSPMANPLQRLSNPPSGNSFSSYPLSS